MWLAGCVRERFKHKMPDSLWDKLPADLQEAIVLEGRHILAREVAGKLKQLYWLHWGVEHFRSDLRRAVGQRNMRWHFMWIPLMTHRDHWWLQESFCGHRLSGHLKGAGWFCEWILGVNCPYEKRRVRARAFSVHVCSSEREIKRANDKLIGGLLEPKHPESLWLPYRPYNLRAVEQLRDDSRRAFFRNSGQVAAVDHLREAALEELGV